MKHEEYNAIMLDLVEVQNDCQEMNTMLIGAVNGEKSYRISHATVSKFISSLRDCAYMLTKIEGKLDRNETLDILMSTIVVHDAFIYAQDSWKSACRSLYTLMLPRFEHSYERYVDSLSHLSHNDESEV